FGISPDQKWARVRSPRNVEGWSFLRGADGKVYLSPIESVVSNVAEGGEPPWMAVARAELGVKEKEGSADNPRIVEFLKTTTIGTPYNENDETPWCSAFVNWVFEKTGIAGTSSAAALSWRTW